MKRFRSRSCCEPSSYKDTAIFIFFLFISLSASAKENSWDLTSWLFDTDLTANGVKTIQIFTLNMLLQVIS